MSAEAGIALTADEVMLLAERVKTTDYGTEDNKVFPCRLLERLGSVYLELVQDDSTVPGTVDVVLSEAEGWLCLDRVSNFDRTQADPLVGVKLKRKLFAHLLALNSPRLGPTVDHIDPDPETVQNALLAYAVEQERGSWDDCPPRKE